MARAITRDNLGAWLVKTRADAGSDIVDMIRAGGVTLTSRRVARGYRADMMQAGDLVLLWVSGDGSRVTRGIWGVGHVAGPVDDRYLPLDVPLLDDPVAAGELVAAGIDDLEVLRMAQGANPSWVSVEQLERIRPLLP